MALAPPPCQSSRRGSGSGHRDEGPRPLGERLEAPGDGRGAGPASVPAGAIGHHRHGNLVLRLVPWLALGAAAGSPLAWHLANRLSKSLLARGFAVFLLASAVQLWLRSGAGQKAKPDPEAERS
jgi:hypothetical protein